MKKIINIIGIVALIVFIFVNKSYASTQIDMNITENSITNTIVRTNNQIQNTNTTNTVSNNSSATISTIQDSSIDAGLGLTNILNIVIIVVGVVIILLAIAVLIRLHS